MTPLPGDCLRVWRALRGVYDKERHRALDGWYSARLLQDLTGQSCADRKARKLYSIGLVDKHDRVDSKTGGLYRDYRIGYGRWFGVDGGRRDSPDAALDRRGEAVAPSPAPAGAGRLFDVPQDKTVLGRTRR